MPLNEIIYDFFDALKSRTWGYGSLDYELIGYRPSRLVKLDILLNGDVVDALSFILFADNAYPRARKICEKLKENIPAPSLKFLSRLPSAAAHALEIIGAAQGRSRHASGGDITRKKKLPKSRRKARSGCVPLAPSRFLPKPSWPS